MYDLHNLGWNSFQQLCLTITRELLGQTVEAFLDAGDGGRDGAFTGKWRTVGQEDLCGQFVIQCKFTSRGGHVIRTSDLRDEIEKAKRLVAMNRCTSYVLMTNAGLTGTRTEEITALFNEVGVKHVAVFGSTWINQQIRENKRLRMLVPRVYGLGDLSQILDERAYIQARTILDSMREDLAKVVVTDAYRRAVESIDRHGFVLIIGEPAAGKTTVASLLAMAAVDQWNASVLKLDDPGKVAERWNPEEPSQFFWVDDVFGVTQYEDFLVRRWNHVLPHVGVMLRRGVKIVMTSRDYIYNRARKYLKDSAFPLIKESQVVIDVRDLTTEEKCQILYNHLRLGTQPRSFLTEIKPFLEGIANHGRFVPETARRLSNPVFTKNLFLTHYHLTRFVEKREIFLQEVLQGLDLDSKAALALVYMRNGCLSSPIELRPSENAAIERLGSTLGGCVSALEALNGSLVAFKHFCNQATWQFKHPTIGDAYAAILVQNPEHLGIFIQGSEPEQLLDQITCGEVGIEKAVVVPKSLFPQILAKLAGFSESKSYKSPWLSSFGAKLRLLRFLAYRCSKDFLATYLQDNSDILDQVSKPGLSLDGAPEVELAHRLHEFELFPEDKRREFVETVSRYALEGQDGSALNDDGIRSLFTDDEFGELLERVRMDLLPRLTEVRYEWESNSSPSETPEEHMQPFLELLGVLKERFSSDMQAVVLIKSEVQSTKDWIYEHSLEESERSPRKLGAVEEEEHRPRSRSIFEDIDVDPDAENDQEPSRELDLDLLF